MAHEVFISYSSKDKSAADALCAALEAEKIQCWIAPRDILPSRDWGESIIDAISESKIVILIFSSNANDSPQVRREVQRAFEKDIPVMPFRIEDVAPTKSLEYYLGQIQWLDALTPPLEKHLVRLTEAVNRLLKPSGALAGEVQQITCGSCGRRNHAGTKFCSECGQRFGTPRVERTGDHSAGVSPNPPVGFKFNRRILTTVLALLGSVGIAFMIYALNGREAYRPTEAGQSKADATPSTNLLGTQTSAGQSRTDATPPTKPVETHPPAVKLYQEMSDAEQMAFVEQQSKRVSKLMGSEQEYSFTPEYLGEIKNRVDAYVKRIGNNQMSSKSEDLWFVLKRGREAAPLIARAFRENNVAPVMGIYTAMVQTQFRNPQAENGAGVSGMFQIIGPVMKIYGMRESDSSNVEKSATVAAKYFKDREKDFSSDPMKEALAVLSYDRNPEGIRREMVAVLNEENKSCSVCALSANGKKPNPYPYHQESDRYLMTFFAAAIIGESPQSFGLDSAPLSATSAQN